MADYEKPSQQFTHCTIKQIKWRYDVKVTHFISMKFVTLLNKQKHYLLSKSQFCAYIVQHCRPVKAGIRRPESLLVLFQWVHHERLINK